MNFAQGEQEPLLTQESKNFAQERIYKLGTDLRKYYTSVRIMALLTRCRCIVSTRDSNFQRKEWLIQLVEVH